MRPTLIFLSADQILDTLNSGSFGKYVHLYNRILVIVMPGTFSQLWFYALKERMESSSPFFYGHDELWNEELLSGFAKYEIMIIE